MTDSAEKMREAIVELRNVAQSAYQKREPMVVFPDDIAALNWAIDALSAGETKSDGGGEVADPQKPEIGSVEFRGKKSLGALPGSCAPTADATALRSSAGVASSPSDPIPSQPDERERVKQVIELAMIEEAEIQYADFTDRDRQREKIIANAADAILAMQAERRGVKP